MVIGAISERWRLAQAGVLLMLAGSLTPEHGEPCAASPLCSCGPAHMSCVALPFHTFPEWPRTELQHLDISMSNLHVVPESALDGLHLQTLLLVANRLHHIEQHAFSSMYETLASLDLGYNEFSEIPLQALRGLKVLNWLNLQNNGISEVAVDIDWKYMKETLTSLSLANNQIWHLKSQAFTYLHHLLQLDLEGNHLRIVDTDSLPPSLTQLKLSNNLLLQISCDLIYNLPRLQALYLNHNFIFFHKNTVCVRNKSQRLERLDLSRNRLNDTSEIHLLRGLQVRQIILDFNELTFVPKLVYLNNRVERLSISYNNILKVQENVFIAIKNSLEELQMDHNRLFQLPDSLSQMERVRHLSLAYNNFEKSPSLPKRLQTLSLAGNFFTSLPSSLKSLNPDSIRYLDLSYNRISNLLPSEVRDWSGSLKTINLRGNRISQIYKNTFPAYMPVEEINLSFNDLYFIHPQSFLNVSSSLQVLEFSSTMFSGYFPFELENPIESLGLLSFDNNDFHVLNLSDLMTFPNLNYVNLDYNRLVQIIPIDNNNSLPLSLKSLRLAYNFLTSIQNKTFIEMPEVRNIDLSYNRINNLTKHSFQNLSNLRYLFLTGNIINYIEQESFYNLHKLEILDLQSNNLTRFSMNIFVNVSSLGKKFTLNMSRNHLNDIYGESKIPVHVFDGSFNDFHKAPSNLFRSIESSIRHVDLSHNKISYIENGVLGNSTNLEILNLHKNNLNILKRKAFSDLYCLQILDLSFNEISQLAVGQFINLNQLRYLRVDHNYIQTLPRDVFKNTVLEYIDLSHNEVSLFPASSLSEVGFTLRYLDLSYNYLEYISSDIFQNTQFLFTLKVSHNLLTVLSDNTFSSLGGLRELDLSNNLIKSNFKELFHNVPDIRHLDLAYTNLKSFPFLPLSNLTFLNLSSNHINSFKENDLKQLVNLRHLDLSHNRFTSLVPKMWIYINNLNSLDISYNPIVRITRFSFKGLINLSHLNVNGLNFLDVIDQDSFRPLISLRSMQIQTWSLINHSTFRISNITDSLPFLCKLTIHWTDEVLDNQLHGIDARNIHYLDIRGTSLRRITDDAFQSFAERQEMFIRVTGTSLTKLPTHLMKHLGQVPHLGLDLSYNQLTTLNPATFYPNSSSWSYVATKLFSGGLILTSNPLRCECELGWLGAWLRRWLQENDAAADLRQGVKSATCKDRLGRTLPLLQLRADEAECHASALSSNATIFSASVHIIVIITFFFMILR